MLPVHMFVGYSVLCYRYVCRLIVKLFVMFVGYSWAHGMLTVDQPQRTLLRGLLTQ